MTRTDYYTIVLTAVNLYFLLEILLAFNATNFIAIFEYKLVVGYVTLAVVVIGLIFILRNLARAVTYVSGNITDGLQFLRPLAIESFLVVISFVTLSISNSAIFYLLNKISV